MVIGNVLGYNPIGTAYTRPAPAREAVTLEAKLNPQSPNEYSVHLPAEIFTLKDKDAEADHSSPANSYQNRDPASRAFLAVAGFQAVKHNIDIFV